MNDSITPLERVNSWIRNSVTLKLITVTFLMVLLLIPASMIESIIEERETLSQTVSQEVSSKWASRQYINGPVLSVPLLCQKVKDDEVINYTKYFHLLPDQLAVNGQISPQKLSRGIYDVIVYGSKLDISGTFGAPGEIDTEDLLEVQLEKAFLTVGITDLKGIQNDIQLTLGKHKLQVEPGSRIPDLISSGITINLPAGCLIGDKPLPFNLHLDLQGSHSLYLTPLGKTSEISLNSTWPSPSFSGNFLPDSRTVTDDGFQADWKILQLNRNFPQSWIGNGMSHKLQASSFGVELISTVDDYKKSMRSAKYAVMTIALTFLIFFLVEILNKRKIHPFQYALVGLALCLFYVLLVSISEHASFNLAYLISSIAVVLMIGLYSFSVFHKKKLTMLLSAILLSVYGFVFVTLQLSDYSLLLGSLGLAVILGLTMYFTRNINWYKLNISVD